MKIVLDPKQIEMIQQMLERIVNVAKEIQLEMKRANDLKEKESKNLKET
jgi:hypothetical protein